MFETIKKLFKEEDSPVEISVKYEPKYWVTKGNCTHIFSVTDILNFVKDWPQTEDELHRTLAKMMTIEMSRS